MFQLSIPNWDLKSALYQVPNSVQYGFIRGWKRRVTLIKWGLLSDAQHQWTVSWRLSQIEVECLGDFEMATEDKGIACWN